MRMYIKSPLMVLIKLNISKYFFLHGYNRDVVICCRPEDRGFESRLCRRVTTFDTFYNSQFHTNDTTTGYSLGSMQ